MFTEGHLKCSINVYQEGKWWLLPLTNFTRITIVHSYWIVINFDSLIFSGNYLYIGDHCSGTVNIRSLGAKIPYLFPEAKGAGTWSSSHEDASQAAPPKSNLLALEALQWPPGIHVPGKKNKLLTSSKLKTTCLGDIKKWKSKVAQLLGFILLWNGLILKEIIVL